MPQHPMAFCLMTIILPPLLCYFYFVCVVYVSSHGFCGGCMCVHVHAYMCAFGWLWRPKANVRCLPSFSSLFLETESLTGPRPS